MAHSPTWNLLTETIVDIWNTVYSAIHRHLEHDFQSHLLRFGTRLTLLFIYIWSWLAELFSDIQKWLTAPSRDIWNMAYNTIHWHLERGSQYHSLKSEICFQCHLFTLQIGFKLPQLHLKLVYSVTRLQWNSIYSTTRLYVESSFNTAQLPWEKLLAGARNCNRK